MCSIKCCTRPLVKELKCSFVERSITVSKKDCVFLLMVFFAISDLSTICEKITITPASTSLRQSSRSVRSILRSFSKKRARLPNFSIWTTKIHSATLVVLLGYALDENPTSLALCRSVDGLLRVRIRYI